MHFVVVTMVFHYICKHCRKREEEEEEEEERK
jgi:hypothetical protein